MTRFGFGDEVDDEAEADEVDDEEEAAAAAEYYFSADPKRCKLICETDPVIIFHTLKRLCLCNCLLKFYSKIWYSGHNTFKLEKNAST